MNTYSEKTSNISINTFSNFGCNEFFNFISDMSNPNYDMNLICQVVERDARKIIYGKGYAQQYRLNYHDVEDILQNTVLSFLKSKERFCRTSWNKAPQQRQSWLVVCVERKVIDYCNNSHGRHRNLTDSINDEDTLIELPDNPDIRGLENAFFSESVNNPEIPESIYTVIDFMFSIDTTPDKMLTSLYNLMTLTNHETRIKNGQPKRVAELMNGKTARAAADIIIDELAQTGKLSDHKAYADIVKSVQYMLSIVKDGVRNEDQIINLSPDAITKTTYWIVRKIKNHFGDKESFVSL